MTEIAKQPDAQESQSHADKKRTSRISIVIGSALEQTDSVVYAIVGICFVFSAILAIGYTFLDFGNSVTHINTTGEFANAIITLISNLLLVLIIMEVLSTVIQYLKAHVTSLTPFLAIGIISATRGILSIGAKLSVQTVEGDEFTHDMIELGVNAGAILALSITLTLINRFSVKTKLEGEHE